MCADLWFYSVVETAVYAEQIAVNCTGSCYMDTVESPYFLSFLQAISVCLGLAGLGEVKLKSNSWDAPKGWGNWLLTLLFPGKGIPFQLGSSLWHCASCAS